MKIVRYVLPLLLVATLTSSTSAHTRLHYDGADTPSPLDFKWFSLGGHEDPYLVALAKMYNPWAKWMIQGADNWITFYFDTVGGPGDDYYVDVWAKDGPGFKGVIYKRTDSGRWRRIATTRAIKYDRKTVAIRVTKSDIKANGNIRWGVQTMRNYEDSNEQEDWSGYKNHRV